MRIHTLERTLWVPRPVEDVFAFFADAGNLEAITPALIRFRILTPMPIDLHAGTRIEYALRWRRVPLRWTTEIALWRPPLGFNDVQLRGPYRLWEHAHRFRAEAGGTTIRDLVRYALPAGRLGEALHRLRVRADLEAIFDHRAERVRELLAPPRTDPGAAPTSEAAGRPNGGRGAQSRPTDGSRVAPD